MNSTTNLYFIIFLNNIKSQCRMRDTEWINRITYVNKKINRIIDDK